MITTEYLCPLCGAKLTDNDVTTDNESLYCPNCATRVEYFYVLEEAESRRRHLETKR